MLYKQYYNKAHAPDRVMYYALNFVMYSTGVHMAKTAILVAGIISMIMMQSVSGASKINYNQDHVENVAEAHIEQEKYINAKLYVRGKGYNLADKDPGTAGQSDPYMIVTATDKYNYKRQLRTPTKVDNNNPIWDEYLKFPQKTWKKITVEIWDNDSWNRDDRLCPITEIGVESGGSLTINCEHGTVIIEWKFVLY